MPFQVICLRNKMFWSRFVSIMAGFTMAIVAMAVVFPAEKSTTDITPTYYTQTEIQNEIETPNN